MVEWIYTCLIYLLRKGDNLREILLAFYLSGNGTTFCCFSSFIKWESPEITLLSSITPLLLWTLIKTKIFAYEKKEVPIIYGGKFAMKFIGRDRVRRKPLEAFFIYQRKLFKNARRE